MDKDLDAYIRRTGDVSSLKDHRFYTDDTLENKEMAERGLFFRLPGASCYIWAENGYLDCLQWAVRSGRKMCPMVCMLATQRGDIEMRQWAHDNGCPWTMSSTIAAVKNGHILILEYLIWNGCPIGADCAAEAVYRGDLPLLKFLRSINCDWDRRCTIPTERRPTLAQQRCYNWARVNGCITHNEVHCPGYLYVRTIWDGYDEEGEMARVYT